MLEIAWVILRKARDDRKKTDLVSRVSNNFTESVRPELVEGREIPASFVHGSTSSPRTERQRNCETRYTS